MLFRSQYIDIDRSLYEDIRERAAELALPYELSRSYQYCGVYGKEQDLRYHLHLDYDTLRRVEYEQDAAYEGC